MAAMMSAASPRIQASFPWEARQLQLHPAGYEGLDLRRALPQPAAAVLAQLARRSGVVGRRSGEHG
jgi:hypothetical protein